MENSEFMKTISHNNELDVQKYLSNFPDELVKLCSFVFLLT